MVRRRLCGCGQHRSPGQRQPAPRRRGLRRAPRKCDRVPVRVQSAWNGQGCAPNIAACTGQHSFRTRAGVQTIRPSHSVAADQVSQQTHLSRIRAFTSRPVPGLSATLERPRGDFPRRCRKMCQHRHRYFHARHRRPSPAIKWHHAARVRIRFQQPGTPAGQARREDPRPGQRRWQEAVPAEGHQPRAAGLAARPAVRGRRHELAAASRELRQHPPRPAGIGLTPHCPLLRPSLRCHARHDRVGHLARTRRQRLR